MNNYKISILFFLQKSRKNKAGKCPVLCRVTYNKKRKEFSTGVSVKIEHWNSTKKKTTDELLNNRLQIIESDINSTFLRLKISQDKFDVITYNNCHYEQ